MKNLWHGNILQGQKLQTIVEKMETNKLCIAGDGSVRDQLGSYAWCLAEKDSETPFFYSTRTGGWTSTPHASFESRVDARAR